MAWIQWISAPEQKALSNDAETFGGVLKRMQYIPTGRGRKREQGSDAPVR